MLLGTPEIRDHFSDLRVDRRIISKWVVRKHCMVKWTEFKIFRIEPNGGILWRRKEIIIIIIIITIIYCYNVDVAGITSFLCGEAQRF
jgi:hypothetical protein